MAGLSSCSQTEIEAVSGQEEIIGEEIAFNIKAPEFLTTRASSDHKLRFTAKLFKDKYNTDEGVQFLEMKQGVATDGNCTIIFSVPQGDYSVLIFADYIPENISPDSQGRYEDTYYDTSSKDENIRMIAFTTNDSGHQLIQRNCINNDNYDCFSAYTGLINKTELKVEKDVVLKRAASKVRFISSTPNDAKVTEIKFNNFACFDGYKQFYESVFTDKRDNDMRLGSHILQGVSNESEKELFYFYTLGANNQENLGTIDFDINFDNGQTRNVHIQGGTIKVMKNHVTTVRGAFLDEEAEELGDIILHLSTNPDWEDPMNTVIEDL